MSKRAFVKRRKRVYIEQLEGRQLLHAAGLTWDAAPDLTISFADDGTQIAGHESALFAQLADLGTESEWQSTIARAFETWAEHTSAQVQIVSDGGHAFGEPGPTQGDPRFGDVRVGALPLSSDIVAMSIPHSSLVSGTWSGDILFNTNAQLASLDELYSVALHEAGHVFGLSHSEDPNSPMFHHGVSENVTPTTEDIAALNSLYGLDVEVETPSGHTEKDDDDDSDSIDYGDEKARPEEDDSDNNNSLLTANAVAVRPGHDQITRYEATGIIESGTDVDFFKLDPGSLEIENLDQLSVVVRATENGGLIPDAAVFDEDGKELKSTVLANSGGRLVLQIPGAEASDLHYVRVQAFPAGQPFESGPYEIEAQFSREGLELRSLESGSLDAETPTAVRQMQINRTQLVHFALRIGDVAEQSDILSWAVIYDQAGDVVARIASPTGETRSTNTTLLQPGDYRVEFHAGSASNAAIPEIDFSLLADTVTIPIGPGVSDPTESPLLPCDDAHADPNYCAPPDILVSDPVAIPEPIPVPAQPVATVDPPWLDIDWWYWDQLLSSLPDAAPKDGEQTVPPSSSSSAAKVSGAFDVDRDGSVSPLDVLAIVNLLNAAADQHGVPHGGFDVNNDSIVSSIDVLLIVNELNNALAPPKTDDPVAASEPATSPPAVAEAATPISVGNADRSPPAREPESARRDEFFTAVGELDSGRLTTDLTS